MNKSILLRQVLLSFQTNATMVRSDLSAVVCTPDGHLWLGSDELTTIECLSPIGASEYGDHRQYKVSDYINLTDTHSEIDIEGMAFSEGYLWLVGSHSAKRRRPSKRKKIDDNQDIQRLAQVTTDANRYVLARIPLVDGVPVKQDKLTGRSAACLQKDETQSALIKALMKDEHIGPFLKIGLPSKDNGFDIEAIAAQGDRLFLGLRGPVLRGMAIILEVEIKASKSKGLKLKKLEGNRRYRKHFVDLNGLGVRDLCFQGDDLIVLAGPTMQIFCKMSLFRFRHVLSYRRDSLWIQPTPALTRLFELPQPALENAEGLTLFPVATGAGTEESLMVIYDSPSEQRLCGETGILADVLRLPLP